MTSPGLDIQVRGSRVGPCRQEPLSADPDLGVAKSGRKPTPAARKSRTMVSEEPRAVEMPVTPVVEAVVSPAPVAGGRDGRGECDSAERGGRRDSDDSLADHDGLSFVGCGLQIHACSHPSWSAVGLILQVWT